MADIAKLTSRVDYSPARSIKTKRDSSGPNPCTPHGIAVSNQVTSRLWRRTSKKCLAGAKYLVVQGITAAIA
ncbi:MAG: hypothetical protein IT422_22185 [Pirellulaceae bacterium]|nr:hypothetical protein [Pirellulaceae bacterium]